MTTSIMVAQSQRAITTKKTFSRQTTVSIDIEADPSIVWALLTNASDYPRWNSTIISLDGDIQLGEKIYLKSTLDEKRIFKLKIKEYQPEKRLVWGDGKGNRIYTIREIPTGVNFSMDEKIGGIMFPMYAGFIPSFDESFDQFATDLKREAELINKVD